MPLLLRTGEAVTVLSFYSGEFHAVSVRRTHKLILYHCCILFNRMYTLSLLLNTKCFVQSWSGSGGKMSLMRLGYTVFSAITI